MQIDVYVDRVEITFSGMIGRIQRNILGSELLRSSSFEMTFRTIDEEIDMPLAYYQKDYVRWCALFVTFPKSQMILFIIIHWENTQLFGVMLGDFILLKTKNVSKLN